MGQLARRDQTRGLLGFLAYATYDMTNLATLGGGVHRDGDDGGLSGIAEVLKFPLNLQTETALEVTA